MGFILFLIMIIIASIGFLLKRNYRMLAIMTIPIFIIGIMFLWYFTMVPYKIGIRKTPEIEFVGIRNATEVDMKTYSYDTDYPLYVVEFSADMRLEKCRKSLYRMYCSPTKANFSYEDVVSDNGMILMESEEITFVKGDNGRYLYDVPFQFLSRSPDLTQSKVLQVGELNTDLYCKIFYIGMLEPVLNTSEMIIPIDSIKKVLY